MRTVLAVILFVHGVAHLPGFVVPWRLATLSQMTYKTTLFGGRVEVGDAGIRVVGLCWLVAALALGVCAVGVLGRVSWWAPLTLITLLVSLLLSIAGWPDSRIGVLVNLAMLALLVVNRQAGWLS